MVETEQLVLEGVLEQEAYGRYLAALDMRRYEYRTDFVIPDENEPERKKLFAIDPIYGPQIYYPDENGSSALSIDANGVVVEAIDDDDIFVHRIPKANEIEEYTKQLIDAVPIVDETGIADRVNGLFDTVEAKLADEQNPYKSLAASYIDDRGFSQSASFRVADNNYFKDRRLTVTTFSGDYSSLITIARSAEGKLSISTEWYRCDSGNEYELEGTNGTVLTHAELDKLEHILFCSKVLVPNTLQQVAAGSRSLGQRVLSRFLDR